MTAWTVFYNPMTLPFGSRLWLLLPLCAVVAIVYKTIRTNNLRRLWIQVLALWGYMLIGLVVLGAAMWLIHEYWR